MEKIDRALWPGNEVYSFFEPLPNPHYMLTFRADVTELYRFVKKNGLSFYYSMTWFCTKALNSVDAFLYTVRDGEIWKLDGRIPSLTDLRPGDARFHVLTLPAGSDLRSFCAAAGEMNRTQKEFLCAEKEQDDLIFISCVPWLDMTAVTNEGIGGPEDCVPRLTWGRYTELNGRKTLCISAEVNHRFVDGAHIGRFYETLQAMLNDPERACGEDGR